MDEEDKILSGWSGGIIFGIIVLIIFLTFVLGIVSYTNTSGLSRNTSAALLSISLISLIIVIIVYMYNKNEYIDTKIEKYGTKVKETIEDFKTNSKIYYLLNITLILTIIGMILATPIIKDNGGNGWIFSVVFIILIAILEAILIYNGKNTLSNAKNNFIYTFVISVVIMIILIAGIVVLYKENNKGWIALLILLLIIFILFIVMIYLYSNRTTSLVVSPPVINDDEDDSFEPDAIPIYSPLSASTSNIPPARTAVNPQSATSNIPPSNTAANPQSAGTATSNIPPSGTAVNSPSAAELFFTQKIDGIELRRLNEDLKRKYAKTYNGMKYDKNTSSKEKRKEIKEYLEEILKNNPNTPEKEIINAEIKFLENDIYFV